MIKEINRDELKKLIDDKGNYVLIDVRQKEELQYGMIPTAHHIPLSEVESAFDLDSSAFEKNYGFSKPARSDLMIVYCRSGGRSSIAAGFLSKKGFKVRNYAGSILDWSEIDENVQAY